MICDLDVAERREIGHTLAIDLSVECLHWTHSVGVEPTQSAVFTEHSIVRVSPSLRWVSRPSSRTKA
jgi:hypothetical protein